MTRPTTGFSLIEVTLALGIVAFALLAVFALLPVGLNLAKESSHEAIALNILGEFNSDVNNATGRTNVSALQEIPLTVTGSGTRYFDETGSYLGKTITPAAIYRSDWVVRARDAAKKVPPSIHFQVGWPAAAPTLIGWVEGMNVLKDNVSTN